MSYLHPRDYPVAMSFEEVALKIIDPSFIQWGIVNIGGGLLFWFILLLMKGRNMLNIATGRVVNSMKQGIKRSFLSFLIRIGFIAFNGCSLYVMFTQPEYIRDMMYWLLAGLYAGALLMRFLPTGKVEREGKEPEPRRDR